MFDYGEIPTSDDFDISTVTDSNIDGYRSISTGHGTSFSSIGYDMDEYGLHYMASSSDDINGESRMMGASYNGIGRDVSTNMKYVYFHNQGSIEW